MSVAVECETFSVEDVVTWESISYRVRTRKTGTIAFVVPPGRDFRYFHRELARHTPCEVQTEGSSRRYYNSYGVLVQRENDVPMLYWPRVSKLELVKRGPNG